MAYAALVSLENTINRFLNLNQFSISVEEKQQITSLLEYVTPIREFLEAFPDKFKSLVKFPDESRSSEEQMRDLANKAEDILEYLVLEKVFLPSDDDSESHCRGNQILNLKGAIKETYSKVENVLRELHEDFPDQAKSLEGRIMDVAKAAEDIYQFYKWEKTHIRFREKWRFAPAELARFKCKTQFIHHLNKTRKEIDSIEEELMAIKNNSDAADSSSTLAPVDWNDGDGDGDGDGEARCHRNEKHELQLGEVMEEIAWIAAQVVKEIKDSSSSNTKHVERGGADSSATPSSSTPISKDAMVGFEDHVVDLKNRLCGEPSKRQVIPICGMGGIGKTTLARNVFQDPLITENFEIRIWVTISQDYSEQEILSRLLESLEKLDKDGKEASADNEEEKNKDGKEASADNEGEKNYDRLVYQILKGRRYLVVMDDIWSSDAWDVVRNVFPDDGNGSRVMLTTRLTDVASYPDPSSKHHEMDLLNADASWDLFKQKVFADEDCPSELENIGKEIARRCKGLPLAIVVIVGLVSTVSKNPASWQEIAEKVKSSETGEQEHIKDILSLSYTQLPQYLRPCFLYMGSFPEDDEIHVKKLIRLWVAEGFMKSPTDSKSIEEKGEECLEELVKRNLALVAKRKRCGRIKSCSLHDMMRDLCIRKARESKFFLNLMDRDIEKECFIESIRNQRRVSVDSSYLSYLSSYDGSTIRSIKCSKHTRAELDFLEGVRLVRVLDADPVDVESLPSELFELFHLRYLAIRYNQNIIPRILSNLQNLETLIIHEEDDSWGSGVSCGILVPWCMPQLRHVYFHGVVCFEDPIETTSALENLHTLSDVVSVCCTERILKKIPNLKKVKIDCSDGGDEACLNDLVHLHSLETLEIWAGRWVQSRPRHYKIAYPGGLKKLTLKDLSLPCGDILVAGSLPNLQVLKLYDCTCEAGTWETTEGAFPKLEVLSIKCARLENWKTESSHFPRLKRLLLHSCWDLKKIPEEVGDISTLELIEVEGHVEMSLVKSAEQIQKEQEDNGNITLQVVFIPKPPRTRRFYSDEFPERRLVEDDDDLRRRFQKMQSDESDDDDDNDSDDDNDDDDEDDDDVC